MGNHEVSGPDQSNGTGRPDKGKDSADHEQDIESAGEAGVNGCEEWSV